jgi:hypothetical protein
VAWDLRMDVKKKKPAPGVGAGQRVDHPMSWMAAWLMLVACARVAIPACCIV